MKNSEQKYKKRNGGTEGEKDQGGIRSAIDRKKKVKTEKTGRQQPSPHPRGVQGAGRMRRAWCSVGTCAFSKLLSRHKLLVSDQVSPSLLTLMVGCYARCGLVLFLKSLVCSFGCCVALVFFSFVAVQFFVLVFVLSSELLYRWVVLGMFVMFSFSLTFLLTDR